MVVKKKLNYTLHQLVKTTVAKHITC